MEVDEYRRMAATEASHWWYAATRQFLRETLEPLLRSDGRYLDAGAGTGATGAWIGDRHELHAVDFFLEAMQIHRELHPATAGLATAELTALPFADARFDGALCVTVLYHQAIADPVDAIREIARVVRPGGFVCLVEPGVRALRRAHDRITHTGRRFSLGDLRAATNAAGLHVERATGVHSYLVPAAAAKALLERGKQESDLDHADDGLRGVLPAVGRRAAAPATPSGATGLAPGGSLRDGPRSRLSGKAQGPPAILTAE